MNEQSYEYRTGQTQPDKSFRGLIAFLLICVIFLTGVVSVLGLMNVHLSRLLQQKEQTPLSFAQGDTAPAPEGETLTLSGITLQELPPIYQQLYELPAGLYVVDAPENGTVQPGDVLIRFNNAAVGSLAALNALQTNCQTGQQVELQFHRQDAEAYQITITFGK